MDHKDTNWLYIHGHVADLEVNFMQSKQVYFAQNWCLISKKVSRHSFLLACILLSFLIGQKKIGFLEICKKKKFYCKQPKSKNMYVFVCVIFKSIRINSILLWFSGNLTKKFISMKTSISSLSCLSMLTQLYLKKPKHVKTAALKPFTWRV